jgi:hypothetical protein
LTFAYLVKLAAFALGGIPALGFSLALGGILTLWALGAFVGKPPLPTLVVRLTADFYGNDPAFQRRVTTAYPAPVSLASLTKDLSGQGYVIAGNTATFEDSDFACRYKWAISWQVEGNRATRINGAYSFICL